MMNFKQQILSWFYPIFVHVQKKSTRGGVSSNAKGVYGASSFYALQGQQGNGETYDFGTLKGKKVLIVNTASNCGYTRQYRSLQSLNEQYNGELVILGFPSNDFKEQEKASDAEIQSFCELNYGVRFPIMKKSIVIKNENQNSVFQWLTHQSQNGWNDQQPVWNFSKYLIDEQGRLMFVFGPAIDPEDEVFVKAVGR